MQVSPSVIVNASRTPCNYKKCGSINPSGSRRMAALDIRRRRRDAGQQPREGKG